jgi:hypothetical protein
MTQTYVTATQTCKKPIWEPTVLYILRSQLQCDYTSRYSTNYLDLIGWHPLPGTVVLYLYQVQCSTWYIPYRTALYRYYSYYLYRYVVVSH